MTEINSSGGKNLTQKNALNTKRRFFKNPSTRAIVVNLSAHGFKNIILNAPAIINIGGA